MINPYFRTLLLLASLSLICACTTTGYTKLPPSEGLVEVKDWNIDQVWIKPGFAPADYSNIMINGDVIDFRTVETRYTPYSRSNNLYPLSDTDQEKYTQIIVEQFSKELKKVEGYSFSDVPSKDTMALDIKLIDVTSNVPPATASRSTIYLSEVGRATLALTFRDSITNETLASIIDRRSAESFDGLGFKESTPVNNWAAVRQLAKHWAKGLRIGLEEMKNSSASPE